MSKQRKRARAAGALLVASTIIVSGCAAGPRAGYEQRLAELRADAQAYESLVERRGDDDDGDLFPNESALTESALVDAVLRRNPTLSAARQAWRAALAAVPQVTALDDPMLAYEVAPLSVPLPGLDRDVPFGQRVMLSQALPFPGKLEARGAVALSSADVVEQDLRATRLSLALLTSQLWADYFATERSLAANEELRSLLEGLRASAEAHLATGHSLLRDPLRAEVQLAHLHHEQVVLESRRRVLRARMNGLLHRSLEAPLPPPPDDVVLPGHDLEAPTMLQSRAVDGRPEVAAAAARIGGAEAALDLAKLSYAPDVAVSGQYTSMFPMFEHQWMVGASLNLPLQLDRRQAERDEAEADVSRALHEHERVLDDVKTEVAVARELALEARHVVDLYETRLLPAARAQLEAARASLEAGTRGYADLLEAEEELRRVRLSREMAVADLLKRRAELEWSLGLIPGLQQDLEGGAR